MKALKHAMRQRRSGQALVEYTLLLALVAVGMLTTLVVYRDSVGPIFGKVTSTLFEVVRGDDGQVGGDDGSTGGDGAGRGDGVGGGRGSGVGNGQGG
jgi:Flp pilus assembly pilin Flp